MTDADMESELLKTVGYFMAVAVGLFLANTMGKGLFTVESTLKVPTHIPSSSATGHGIACVNVNVCLCVISDSDTAWQLGVLID